jgi:transcriptional repressor NrdR
VAYLRFASVYRAFESADDFEAEIAVLRAERAVHPRLVETPRLVEEGEERARLETSAAQPQPSG